VTGWWGALLRNPLQKALKGFADRFPASRIHREVSRKGRRSSSEPFVAAVGFAGLRSRERQLRVESKNF
jgi:hypothetical protein